MKCAADELTQTTLTLHSGSFFAVSSSEKALCRRFDPMEIVEIKMEIVQCALGLRASFFDPGYRCRGFLRGSGRYIYGTVAGVEEAGEFFTYAC